MNGGKGIYVGGTLVSILISLALYAKGRRERAPREAVYRAEMLKWRIEGGGLRPRRPRSLAGRR